VYKLIKLASKVIKLSLLKEIMGNSIHAPRDLMRWFNVNGTFSKDFDIYGITGQVIAPGALGLSMNIYNPKI
jgi:hypothetical protein